MQLSQLVNVKQRRLVDATSAFRLENGPSTFLHLALSCPVKPYNRDIAIEGVLAYRIQHFEYETACCQIIGFGRLVGKNGYCGFRSYDDFVIGEVFSLRHS